MFLEQKTSGLYLWKKSFGKTFLVKIDIEGITEKKLLALTQKEVLHIQQSQWYKKFAQELFHEKILEDVLFQSKFLSNIIEICDIIIKRNPGFYLKEISQESYEETLATRWLYISWFLNRQFPKIFIYNSNHIEGSRIPKDELDKIIEKKKYTHKVKNEVREVQNSFRAWKFLEKDFIFTVSHIKKLYHILTKELLQETWEKYPRGFKKVPNIAGINSATTPPERVNNEINLLLLTYKQQKKEVFPLQTAFDFHLKYEQIHPFENGNGRTGRLLMNKILLQNNMLPIIVFSENKKSYSSAIASSNSGRKKKYYNFMLEQYKKTLEQIYTLPGWNTSDLNVLFQDIDSKKDRN